MDEQNWAEYYKDPYKNDDPELERLLAEEQAIEQQIRDAHELQKDLSSVEHNVQALTRSLLWASEIAVSTHNAEVVLAIATLVKFARDLS